MVFTHLWELRGLFHRAARLHIGRRELRNQRTIAPEAFERTIRQCGRAIVSTEFETVPFDFLPADYLKTLWATLE